MARVIHDRVAYHPPTMRVKRRLFFWLGVLFLVPTSLLGAKARFTCNGNKSDHYALVIGNASYSSSGNVAFDPLPKVVHDREDMAKALCKQGFAVSLGMDQTLEEMRDDIKALKAQDSQLVVIYFSGHGLQQGGFNYLIPIGADIQPGDDLEDKALNLADIYDAVKVGPDFPGRAAVIVLDACRSNYTKSGVETPGLAMPSYAPAGITVAFATAPGTKANNVLKVDNVELAHSPYTEFLLKYIPQRGLALPELFANVRKDLMSASRNNVQIPWENSSALDKTFIARPVVADWKVDDVDDVIEVLVGKQPVLQRTYPGREWDPTPVEFLKPGRNAFEIRIYNDKTFHNSSLFGSIREGWHFKLKLRIDNAEVYSFGCSEDEPPRSRWGQVFTALKGYIDVDVVDGTVRVKNSMCEYGTRNID
jgi:hypothetical protein